ncbi:MAG: DNA repair protein RecN [Verrucomicrobia bacterium]|nr:DNA repair protein RecN [Verrucomicrobiota bacterium]
MIQYLKIRNLVLMDSAELEWGRGFTAVTGETGAGKSVLLGALALLSGARAEKSWIRQGEDCCEVEAVLHVDEQQGIHAKLSELDLPPCEEGALLISRSVSRTKAPRVAINGRLTTVANLQQLSFSWIDFHGPGEPQKLFQESLQLELLDMFARQEGLISSYTNVFQDYGTIQKELTRLRSSEQLSADEKEFITRQIAAIDAVNPTEAAIAELERNYSRVSNAQELSEAAAGLSEGLAGDDGVAGKLSSLLPAARDLADIDPDLVPLSERMQSVIIELNDLAESYADASQQADLDPREAQRLEDQMNRWMELKRKYGGDPSSIMNRRQALQAKLDAQGDIAGSVAKLEKKLASIRQQLKTLADQLYAARLQAAAELEQSAVAASMTSGLKRHVSVSR